MVARAKITIHDLGCIVLLPSGAKVFGEVCEDIDQTPTAIDLGYGTDVLQMVKDHDPLHARLCEWLGLESFSLREAIGVSVDSELAILEEAAVLAVQKFMRHAGGQLPL